MSKRALVINDPSFQSKHRINEIICKWTHDFKGRPLRILETCQGKGDATQIYKRYGYVISFELDPEKHKESCNRFPDAFSLDSCLEQGKDLLSIATYYKQGSEYPVILPRNPTDAKDGIRKLIEYTQKFDVIDVDPYGSPLEFFPHVLDLLDDKSILLVTTGEMYRMRFDASKVLAIHKVRADPSLKWARTFFRRHCALVTGAEILKMGLKRQIGLHPIFILDYYKGGRGGGVQRIGYYACQGLSAVQKGEIRRYLAFDLSLSVKSLKYFPLRKNLSDVSLPCKFSDNSPLSLVKNAIIKRLNYIRSKNV